MRQEPEGGKGERTSMPGGKAKKRYFNNALEHRRKRNLCCDHGNADRQHPHKGVPSRGGSQSGKKGLKRPQTIKIEGLRESRLRGEARQGGTERIKKETGGGLPLSRSFSKREGEGKRAFQKPQFTIKFTWLRPFDRVGGEVGGRRTMEDALGSGGTKQSLSSWKGRGRVTGRIVGKVLGQKVVSYRVQKRSIMRRKKKKKKETTQNHNYQKHLLSLVMQ